MPTKTVELRCLVIFNLVDARHLTGGGLAAAVEWGYFVRTDRRLPQRFSDEDDKSSHFALTGPDLLSVLPSATAAC